MKFKQRSKKVIFSLVQLIFGEFIPTISHRWQWGGIIGYLLIDWVA